METQIFHRVREEKTCKAIWQCTWLVDLQDD